MIPYLEWITFKAIYVHNVMLHYEELAGLKDSGDFKFPPQKTL